MNILILKENEKISDEKFKITGSKFLHLKNILQVKVGQKIFTGELDGLRGFAEVLEINPTSILVNVDLNQKPLEALPIKLILALPRPKILKRILRNISMLGVKEVYLINTYKVEKSFWKSKVLVDKNYETYFLQGLEQSRDTLMPRLYLKNRFKPFVEDELPAIIKGSTALAAHPGPHPVFPQGIRNPLTLAIGPEGGFTDYEIDKLIEAGFQVVQCGTRILRVETALVSLLSQHGLFLQ